MLIDRTLGYISSLFEVAHASRVVAIAHGVGRKPKENKAGEALAAKRWQQNDDAQIAIAASRLMRYRATKSWGSRPRLRAVVASRLSNDVTSKLTIRVSKSSRKLVLKLLLVISFLATTGGCGKNEPEVKPTVTSRIAQAVTKAKDESPTPTPIRSHFDELPVAPGDPPMEPDPSRTLGTLTDNSGTSRFEDAPTILAADNSELPTIDDERVVAAGIRKLTGKHLTLYTDLPAAPAIDELPQVFDAALPQWLEYFGVDAAVAESWQQVGYLMLDKVRFTTAGLLPADLPPFLHGYQRDSELWLYEQPSDYYRRHLLLHEGTHGFMKRFLGGAGPPWYMEGMAELFGTHRWENGQLDLQWFPEDKEQTAMWGRIKAIQDDYRAGRGKTIEDILRYDKTAHLQVEPYAWSWAAAVFFDSHPKYQDRFRELPKFAPDDTMTFSLRLYNGLQDEWPSVARQWHVFLANMDYGYDIAREAIDAKSVMEVPETDAAISIAADRGWQSTGYRLEAGVKYKIEASGRFQLATDPKIWWSEPNGVTIRYHKGLPLGMLIGAIIDETAGDGGALPLIDPKAIGIGGEYPVEDSGTLYLRINDSPAELDDNAGAVQVRITKLPEG